MRIVAVVVLTLAGAAACDSGGSLPPPAPNLSTTPPAVNSPAHAVAGRPPSGGGPFTLDVTTGTDSVRIVPGPAGP